jgi:hypothetical protein
MSSEDVRREFEAAAAAAIDFSAAEDGPFPYPEQCIVGPFKQWVDLLRNRSESPDGFMVEEVATAVCLYAGRRCYIDFARPVYLTNPVLLTGRSGQTHKNTSIWRARRLAKALCPELIEISKVSSMEGALEYLSKHNGSRMLIAETGIAHLFGAAQRKTTGNLVSFLNDAADGVDPLQVIRANPIEVKDAHVCLIGGTTPRWLKAHVDNDKVALGLVNRLAIIFCARERVVPWPPALPQHELDDFRFQLQQALDRALRHGGPITFEPDAKQWLTQWQERWNEQRACLPEEIDDLVSRTAEMAMKRAAVYGLAQGRDRPNLDDAHAGVAFAKWVARNNIEFFTETDLSMVQRLHRRVLTFANNGGGTLRELERKLGSKYPAEMVKREVRSCFDLQLIGGNGPLFANGVGPNCIFSPQATNHRGQNRRRNGKGGSG